MYGVELMIIIFATLAHALASNSPSINIVGVIIFWRVLMGIGIGGDYPLSSIITSEFATTKWRGAMMGSVFAMQGIGQLCAAFIMLFVTVGFKGSLESAPSTKTCTGECALAVDKMWRTLIGFGAVPGVIALYYRLTIPETPRYTFDVQKDVEKADQDAKFYVSGKRGEADVDGVARIAAAKNANETMQVQKASFGDFMRHYAKPKNGMLLAGTSLSWFFLDVAYYGLSLNNATILQAIGYATSNNKNVYEFLYNNAVGNLIIVLAGAVPGYWVTVATVDTIGRKPIQLAGFAILTVLFIIMGFAYDKLGQNGLLAVYVLAQFFFNFGPNSTTFIVPGECFPTRYRSTSHGISAASGKIGSIIGMIPSSPSCQPHELATNPFISSGQGAIAPLRTRGATSSNASPWLNHVLEIYSLFMLCGVFSTLLIKETKRKTLEELADEDDYAIHHHDGLPPSTGEGVLEKDRTHTPEDSV